MPLGMVTCAVSCNGVLCDSMNPTQCFAMSRCTVQCSAVQNVLRYSTLCHCASIVRELFALMNGTKKWNMSPEPALIAFIQLVSFCWVCDGVSIRAIMQNLVCSTPVKSILGRSLSSPETWHQGYLRFFFNFKWNFLPGYQDTSLYAPRNLGHGVLQQFLHGVLTSTSSLPGDIRAGQGSFVDFNLVAECPVYYKTNLLM